MNATVLKYRLYNLALRMGPTTAQLLTRKTIAGNSAATDDGTDGTAGTYNLNRVTYSDDLTSDEQAVTQAAVANVWRLWIVYQADLDQASAPQPVPLQKLVFPDGTTWIIEKVTGTAMLQAWRCLSRKTH